MIKITDKAAIKLKELRKSENYTLDFIIRVKVKGGGCSGLLYDLKFDNNISEILFDAPIILVGRIALSVEIKIKFLILLDDEIFIKL